MKRFTIFVAINHISKIIVTWQLMDKPYETDPFRPNERDPFRRMNLTPVRQSKLTPIYPGLQLIRKLFEIGGEGSK